MPLMLAFGKLIGDSQLVFFSHGERLPVYSIEGKDPEYA